MRFPSTAGLAEPVSTQKKSALTGETGEGGKWNLRSVYDQK